MAKPGSSLRAVFYALGANFGIAVAKTAAALYTGSSAMTAEAIHSFADTGNQILLLVGLRRAERAPDAEHPLGYGKATFFWAFVVALMLFSLGGLFSLYEGWHKLTDPRPLEQAWVAVVVLLVSMALEGSSLAGCLREIRALRGERSLLAWLREARRAELVVVLGEDLGALIGLALALGFVGLAMATGDPRFDALGSMAIGVVLIGISVTLAVRIESLLLGRSAHPDIEEAIEEFIAGETGVEQVYNVITVQLGPKVMLAAKIRLDSSLGIVAACERINALERHLRGRFPEIAWSFIEPDVRD